MLPLVPPNHAHRGNGGIDQDGRLLGQCAVEIERFARYVLQHKGRHLLPDQDGTDRIGCFSYAVREAGRRCGRRF